MGCRATQNEHSAIKQSGAGHGNATPFGGNPAPFTESVLISRTDTKQTGSQNPPASIQGGPAAFMPVPVAAPQDDVALDVAPQGHAGGAQQPVAHALWQLADGMRGDLHDLANRVAHHASPNGVYQILRSHPRVVLAATAVLTLGGLTTVAMAITRDGGYECRTVPGLA